MQSHCLVAIRLLGGQLVGGESNSWWGFCWWQDARKPFGPARREGGGEPFLMHVSHSHMPKFPLPLLLLTPAMQASKNTINDPVFQGCH